MSEGHFFLSLSQFYCHLLFQMVVVLFLCGCVTLFVPSSSCGFLKSLIWNTPTSPQFCVCIPLIAFIGANPSWNPELIFKDPECIIVMHTLRILHCVAMVSLFTLHHMWRNTPPLLSLKQFCPSRRGKCGLNAQEELRKSFILLIKTDSGPEGVNGSLNLKPGALDSRWMIQRHQNYFTKTSAFILMIKKTYVLFRTINLPEKTFSHKLDAIKQWFSTFFFYWTALWSKCKSHGPHACHLHITPSIQTNQILNIIYSLNIMISKRLHLVN